MKEIKPSRGNTRGESRTGERDADVGTPSLDVRTEGLEAEAGGELHFEPALQSGQTGAAKCRRRRLACEQRGQIGLQRDAQPGGDFRARVGKVTIRIQK